MASRARPDQVVLSLPGRPSAGSPKPRLPGNAVACLIRSAGRESSACALPTTAGLTAWSSRRRRPVRASATCTPGSGWSARAAGTWH